MHYLSANSFNVTKTAIKTAPELTFQTGYTRVGMILRKRLLSILGCLDWIQRFAMGLQFLSAGGQRFLLGDRFLSPLGRLFPNIVYSLHFSGESRGNGQSQRTKMMKISDAATPAGSNGGTRTKNGSLIPTKGFAFGSRGADGSMGRLHHRSCTQCPIH